MAEVDVKLRPKTPPSSSEGDSSDGYSDSGGSRNIGSSKKVITPQSRKRPVDRTPHDDSSGSDEDEENSPKQKKKKTQLPKQEPESLLTRTGKQTG
jgi:hypothetical protein